MIYHTARFVGLLVIMLSLHGLVQAQETETLFSSPDIRHGGYGAPVFGVTVVNGQASYLRGIRGAWVINLSDERAIQLGLSNYRTRSDFEARRWQAGMEGSPEMRTNYGGFEIEYVHRPSQMFHVGVQALIGGGQVRYRDSDVDLDRTTDHYFAFQPGVNGILNLTSWFRLSGGVHYRYASGVNLEGTSSSDLSGIVSFIALRFGKF